MSSSLLPTTLAADAGFNPGSLLLPALLVIMLVFMFTRSRKAQQQALERRNSIAPGMRVLSTAGLYGTVVSRDDETNSAVVRIADGVNVTMHLGTINPAEMVVQGSIPAESAPAAPAPAEQAGHGFAADPEARASEGYPDENRGGYPQERP